MAPDHAGAVLGAYLAGELPAERRDMVEHHLLTCVRCRAEVDAARRGRAAVEQAGEPAPDRLRRRVFAAIAAARARPPDTRDG